MTTFSPIFIFWYIFPIIVLLAARLLESFFSLNKRFHIKSPDLAVPFLLYGVHKMSVIALQQSIFPFFLLSLCLLGIALAIFHAYFYDEIRYGHFFKMYWRSVFLLTLILHVALIVLSLIGLA